jgi:hypothetical protein
MDKVKVNANANNMAASLGALLSLTNALIETHPDHCALLDAFKKSRKAAEDLLIDSTASDAQRQEVSVEMDLAEKRIRSIIRTKCLARQSPTRSS